MKQIVVPKSLVAPAAPPAAASSAAPRPRRRPPCPGHALAAPQLLCGRRPGQAGVPRAAAVLGGQGRAKRAILY